MENYYRAEKHWYFWVNIAIFSILLCWTIIIPIWLIIYGALRWKLDKLEIKDGNLCSRMGVIFIDKKTIPLDKISFITERTDIISEWLGFGALKVQSSAFGKAVEYTCIKNTSGFIEFYNKIKDENK